MTFKVGETVVYPHHGAATIEEITTRVIGGVEREYLRLRVAQGDLTIQIPSENVEMVGVRDVVDEAGLEHVFEVLRAKKTDEPSNWSRRYKANVEKSLPATWSRWPKSCVTCPAVTRTADCPPAKSGC